MIKKILTFLVFLFLFQMHAFCQPSVNTAVDSNLFWIGDPITVNLIVSDPLNNISNIRTDTSFSADPAVDVIKFDNWLKNPADDTWESKVIVGVYDSGAYKLPEFHLLLKTASSIDTLYTDTKLVHVRTLPVSDTTSIAPIKNIITTPATLHDYLPWIIAAMAFLILLLGMIYFIRKKAQSPKDPPLVMSPIAAYDLAYTQLTRLRDIRLWEKGKVMEYQIELTQIIRAYVSNRYQLPAMELSSSEILASLRSKINEPNTYSYLGNLLEVGDYVKFAKGIPPDEIHEHVMQMALSFIEKTKS